MPKVQSSLSASGVASTSTLAAASGGLSAIAPSTVNSAPSRQIRQGFKRSRNGCLTCRRYHSKCDEQGPSCLRCRQGLRECLWPENIKEEKSKSPPADEVVIESPRPVPPTPPAVPAPPRHKQDDNEDGKFVAANALDPRFLDSLLGVGPFALDRPLEPSELVYPRPKERQMMSLFVREAPKLMLNIALQPHIVTFLDLPHILWDPESGLSADALRFSMISIGSLVQAWSARASTDPSILTSSLTIANHMGKASRSCLQASMVLGGTTTVGPCGADLDSIGLMSAVMLSLGQVLAGVAGQREPFDMAYDLVNRSGGPVAMTGRVKGTKQQSAVRKVMEYVAVADVLDAIGARREPNFLATGDQEQWWARSSITSRNGELDSVETTFGVSRDFFNIFAKVVKLSARNHQAQRITDVYSPGYLEFLSPTSEEDDPLVQLNLLMESNQLEGELDAWESSYDADVCLPRASHGNKIYILTSKVLLNRNIRGVRRDDPIVQAHSATILDLLLSCHTRFGGVLYLMWPLLLAAANVDPAGRYVALQVLDAFAATYLFDCSSALLVLNNTWEQIDQGDDVNVQQVVGDLGFQFL